MMGDSVGTSVSGGGGGSRSSSGRKRTGLNTSLYRPYRPLSTPKVPQDSVAMEILQTRFQHQKNQQKLEAIQNRIRKLQTQELKAQKQAENQRRNQAFLSHIRERRMDEEKERERTRSERQAAELESRIYHLRTKQARTKQIATARSRLLSEKREIVEEVKQECCYLDKTLESMRVIDRQNNIDRRRVIDREQKRFREQRRLSANGHKELLKVQYQHKLQQEKEKAEEDERQLQELEKLQTELSERLGGTKTVLSGA